MYIRVLKIVSCIVLCAAITSYSGSNEFVVSKKSKQKVSRSKENGGQCMGEIARLLAHTNRALADTEIMNIEALEKLIENSDDAVFAGADRTEAQGICGKLERCKKTAEQILHLSNQLAAEYRTITAS